jgi:hypothetical protein
MDKITVLFPGGFKPLTGAHLELATRYAQVADVEKVILLIGEKPREEITREKTIEIFNLLNTNPKIEIQPTQFNSPIMAAYEYLFELPEDASGRYAMAASTKGDDYVRAKDFVPNVDKYKTVGDKKGRMIPTGIDATELSIDIDPLLYSNGQPISASTIRTALANNDYATFRASYPMQLDAQVKQIWNILNGATNEQLFTKSWWTSVLMEDIDEVVEAIMNPREKSRHDSKIKKLRNYLDNNRGDDFVYDFNDFDKTVVGADLLEQRGRHEITREDLANLEPIIDGFFREYGIDVDFQGKYTHFLDRLNDPRNESPIYTDELQNFFEDLADEYGDAISRQLSNKKPTGVGSDYQFDVPMHMPFQLQWNSNTNMIELIPRTVKKQKKRWQSNDPNDIEYRIESLMRENRVTAGNLIKEGGAAGHMAHPWDDHGLTFNDMKEIVYRGLSGRLDIEAPVTEKTDGQNIQVTWKNGEIGFARGKGTIINPMTTTEIIADFHRKQQKAVDERGAAAGEDYQRVVDAYQACAEDLTQSLRSIPQDKLNQIFKNGRVFANMEIIYPATKNVISYEKAHLQFHNLVEYNDKGLVVLTDLAGGKFMQKIIEDANAHMQNTFSFIPPQQIKLGRIDKFEDQQNAFINEIDQLKNQFGLQETDLISEYHKAWWKNVIETKATQLGYEIPEAVLTALIYRWAFNDKSTNIAMLKKQIENPEFVTWTDAFDKKDFKMYQKQNLEPFESIFLRLGVVVLQNSTNFLAANPNKTVQEIKSELTKLIKELQIKNDPTVLNQLQTQLKRIERIGGFNSIVPSEGIVFVYDGNTYKLTGAFAPINQILGTLKYAR